MRVPMAFVLLLLLLAVVPCAMAEETAPAEPITTQETGPEITPAQSDDCDDEDQELNFTELLNPKPISQTLTCGGCSQDPCKNCDYNTICGFSGGQIKRCISLLGNNCPSTPTLNCQCTSSPEY